MSSPTFSIPGVPVPKGRPRVFRRGGRPRTPKKTREYERIVAWSARSAGVRVLEGPLEVSILAVWPMTGKPRKRVPRPERWKATLPDADNVAKSILDGLNGIAFRDDGQVARLVVETVHAAQGQEPHVEVTISHLPEREASHG